ncbi:type II toxin-antitoxin system HicB family antitoxin [bacterium]|nr:type II toxin-antitoxin system HicB family antitoxin [bacterium]
MKYEKFLVVIEKGPKNFCAYSPDLPGVFTTGKTREETERNMLEALQLHVDGMKADGDKIPRPESSALTMMVEVPTKTEAKKRLEKDKVKPNSWPKLSSRALTSR